MNRTVSNRRLLKLANFLATSVPKEQFDYEVIAESPPGEEIKDTVGLSCGTSACALGWAGTIPEFRKRGLRLEINEEDPTQADVTFRPEGEDYSVNSYKNLHAGAIFFGISNEEADTLFNPFHNNVSYDATPKQVAKHIKNFVKNRFVEKASYED